MNYNSLKSWRSSVSGLVGSFAGLVLTLAGAGIVMPKWIIVTAGFVATGGFLSLGIVGKDAEVHSTPSEVQIAGEKR